MWITSDTFCWQICSYPLSRYPFKINYLEIPSRRRINRKIKWFWLFRDRNPSRARAALSTCRVLPIASGILRKTTWTAKIRTARCTAIHKANWRMFFSPESWHEDWSLKAVKWQLMLFILVLWILNWAVTSEKWLFCFTSSSWNRFFSCFLKHQKLERKLQFTLVGLSSRPHLDSLINNNFTFPSAWTRIG